MPVCRGVPPLSASDSVSACVCACRSCASAAWCRRGRSSSLARTQRCVLLWQLHPVRMRSKVSRCGLVQCCGMTRRRPMTVGGPSCAKRFEEARGYVSINQPGCAARPSDCPGSWRPIGPEFTEPRLRRGDWLHRAHHRARRGGRLHRHRHSSGPSRPSPSADFLRPPHTPQLTRGHVCVAVAPRFSTPT